MSSSALEKRPELPEPVARRGITEAQWRTLKSSLYPGASSDAVLMVIDYCTARRLDPLKKPCHIVPVEVRVGDRYEWREIVMPGIYELRTTAQRTDLYLGHSTPAYADTLVDVGGVKAPEWCAITMYRYHPGTGRTIEFPIRVYFREVVATDKAGKVNARWRRAPVQMLTKCTEAAGLREAFPDEIGGEHAAEEMDGQRLTVDVEPSSATAPADVLITPDGFDAWRDDLVAVADEGSELFASAWSASAEAMREYLMATEPEQYERLKAHAATKDPQS